MPNPQQINANITKNMKDINPLNKLTPPDPFNTLLKDPKYKNRSWEIGLMQDTIGIMRPLTPEEKARVERWVMFWEKTYWMWINDSIPAMSSEELEEWKTKAKLKLEEFSKMWTAFADVMSSKEAKESVEKLSDAIVKFGAAITYVTTMFSGKMMIKFRPEVKLALDSAILIFQQSIADVGAGALSTAVGPLATAPKLLFNAIQSISKSMQFTAVALQSLTEAGFLTALGFDQGLQPFLELMKSAQEAIDSIKTIVNDATNVLNQEPPTPEVMKKVTEIEMSMPGTTGVTPAQPVQPIQPAPPQPAPPQPAPPQPATSESKVPPPAPAQPQMSDEDEEEFKNDIIDINKSKESNFTGMLERWKDTPKEEAIKAAVDAKLSNIQPSTQSNLIPTNLNTGGLLNTPKTSFKQTIKVGGRRKTLKKRKKRKSRRKSRKSRKSRKY